MSVDIKDITTITELSALTSGVDTDVYVEHGGLFRRAGASVAREALGLGGLVVDSEGQLCVEIDEE